MEARRPVEVPEFAVLARDWDAAPGVEKPDYRNPDAKDTLQLKPGQDVIVGKQGSEDNPRRLAEVQDDGRLVDKPNEPEPELPSGEDLLEPDDKGKSGWERFRDNAAKPDVIGGVHDVGGRMISTFEALHNDRSQPTGSIVGTPDRPVVNNAPREGVEGGALVTLPLIAVVIAHQAIRSVREWSDARKLERVEQIDAGD